MIKLLISLIRRFFAKLRLKRAIKIFEAKPDLISIYIGNPRRIVKAELVQNNFYTVWVRLFDGHIIKRKKKRDIVLIEGGG